MKKVILGGTILLAFLAALSFGQGAMPSGQIKIPETIQQLRANFVSISTMPVLGADVKQKAREASGRMESEFKKTWDPLMRINDRFLELAQRIKNHNDEGKTIDPENEAQVAAFNQEKARLDREQDDMRSTLFPEVDRLSAQLEAYLKSPWIAETLRVTEQILHPPVYFNYGLAWLQLKGLAGNTLDWDGRSNVVSGEGTITLECLPPRIQSSPGAQQARKGFLCIEDGDYPAAKAWFQRALQLDPKNPLLREMVEFCQQNIVAR